MRTTIIHWYGKAVYLYGRILRFIFGYTSRYCPQCFIEHRRYVVREREYEIFGPMTFAKTNPELTELKPKRSNCWVFRVVPILHWLFYPPSSKSDEDVIWYEVYGHATCPEKEHGREQVLEGIRTYGRARIFLFWFRKWILPRSFQWIVPLR